MDHYTAEAWAHLAKSRELNDTVNELRQAVGQFVATYNTKWLIGRLGHRTPNEAYKAAHVTAAA